MLTEPMITTAIEPVSEMEFDKNSKDDRTTGLNNNNERKLDEKIPEANDDVEYVPKIMWPDLFAQLFVHGGCVYGLYLILTGQVMFYTVLWGTSNVVGLLIGFGVID